MEPSEALHTLGTFRHSFYECLHRRADTLFELTDALLTADSAVPSPVHLSLEASHRRGWGSLYAAWDRCDAECSPERGYYYHPSRHSAGQPIVAGWAYQFIARLNLVRESWTAPVLASLVHLPTPAGRVATDRRCEVFGFKHLARALHGVHMRGRRLRDGARACLGEDAS